MTFNFLGIAKYLNIIQSQSKECLVHSIFKKFDQDAEVKSKEDEEAISTYGTTFRKNKNTFPRLCNFMLKDSERLACSKLISNRGTLQNNEMGENNTLYEEAIRSFNDISINSGG